MQIAEKLSLDITETLQCSYDGVVHYEEWLPIKGYEGKYEISNFGRAKSLDRLTPYGRGNYLRSIKGKILAPGYSTRGYKLVGLYINSVMRNGYIHRLVAEHFIPNPLNKPEVNHKKGFKYDNRVWELEWCTSSENTIHAINTGLHIIKRGDSHSGAVLTADIVRHIRYLWKSTKHKVTLKQLGDKYGVTISAISAVVNNRNWKHIL